MLEGRNFTIYTDHKPLIYAFTQKHEKCSPRQIRHLDWIGQFSTDIRHISGSLNVVADSLSRISEIEMPSPIDYKEFAKVQLSDEEFQLLNSCTNSLKFQLLKVPRMDTELFCDISTGRCHPFVPKEFRRRIFETLHNLSHPGVKATRSKIQRHTVSPLGTYPVPRHRFDHVHIDLVGPLPPSRGYTYALARVDRFSRWPEVIPLKDIKAETVAFEFYANWIARFGVHEKLTSDQGRQFESRLFREFARLLGVKVVHTTPYHPQANGSVERLHRQLKSAIRTHATERWTVDRLTKSLVPPYSGPHLVVSRTSKHFTIQVGSCQQTVSIDRLKPAFQLAEIQPFRVSFFI
ncbi:Transposon Tf2-8 polyprotein [Araneus ventricosus]|uniref:Transposon Tf2-8 polyprotein n=1 Tax=Araneus ventricosus TaxID=182803 RepID=A0A4Y2NHQ6_ARAVE|nr:Transposon Tf2-8 polyprotein [Araneus ventricosus]